MHRPGTLCSYTIIATRNSDGTAEGERAVQETLDFAMKMEVAIALQDADIPNTIRFSRGTFTRRDKALGKFVDYLKTYPRAHPGADYIKYMGLPPALTKIHTQGSSGLGSPIAPEGLMSR